MRHSCNGCRTLRKGCKEDCVIRPCLEWINNPEAQGNATLFLAKFYGRTGLQNLLSAAPQHLRPGVFKSLLYEACGRIANPAYGSLGLFWTGEWARCQSAVDAVLSGAQMNATEYSHSQGKGTHDSEHVSAALGIRHVSRAVDVDRLKVKEKGKLKRTGNVIKPKPRVGSIDSATLWRPGSSHELGESSREPGGSDGDSEKTLEAMLVVHDKPSRNDGAELNLELTLG